MNIIYSGICDKGLKRTVNQDAMMIYDGRDKNMMLFAVADGMGGHSDGELASRTIVEILTNWADGFEENTYEQDFTQMMTSLKGKLEAANQTIYEKYNKDRVCGSTCILLFIYKTQYGVLSVGDSRIYLQRGFWSTRSLMMDDVWENQLSVKERFDKKEIKKHPNYGKLLSAIGTMPVAAISSKTDELKQGDTFLLCSDGLYKYCPEKYMYSNLCRVNRKNVQSVVKNLFLKTCKMGAKDNLTIIIVKCQKEKR